MAEKSVVNALPKLPGFDFSALNQPATFNKSHSFAVVQGMPIVKTPVSQGSTPQQAPGAQDPAFSDFAIFSAHPQWKTLSDKVLRFFGYFTERVEESAIERMRVRKVCVLFYLGDRTVSVTETPSTVNSGLRGGSIMSRHVDPAAKASALRVGDAVAMRARTITIVDCDAATRQFYATMGHPQPSAIDYPPDSFEALQARPTQIVDAAHADMRRVVEMTVAAASGHQSTRLSPEERVRAQSFLKHDREVLNFNATWDRRLFRVNFFLSDGTMAVTMLHTPNDGRDPNAAFVKRGVIPKGRYQLKAIDTCSAQTAPECFTDLDLGTGRTITLFGRDFYMYACDPFTKAYYKRVHGIDMEDVPRGPVEGDVAHRETVWELPPPTGFGSDEDSMGSYRSIVMKPPRKDYAKYIERANDVLRYASVLANPAPEDECRRFIVCYYLADDTVSVYEYAVRNSGHNGGKIFARSKVAGVTEASFYEGAELKLGGYIFRLTHCDERTSKFLETGAPMGGLSGNTKADELLARARDVLTQRFSRVTEAYRHFNVSKTGLGVADLKRLFAECDIKVEDPALLADVMALADRDADGVISLQEFVENVLRQSLIATSNAAAATPGSPSSASPAPLTSSVPPRSYQELQEAKNRREFADRVLKNFIAKLEARRAFIVDTFRIVSDRSIDGLIGADTFRQVVQDRLGFNLTPDEMDALIYRFYYVPDMVNWEKRRLSLREFRRVIDK